MVGAPASGKTHFTSHYPSSWRVSLDDFRRQITDTEADEGATPAAMQLQTIVLNEQVLPDEDAEELAYLIDVDPDTVRAAHRHAVTADAQSQAFMDQHGLSGLDAHLDALSAQL